MDRIAWTARVSSGEAHRRAGGRRRYNAWRRFAQLHRRHLLSEALQETGMGRGYQSQLARRLGVHRSTVHRDVQALLGQIREEGRRKPNNGRARDETGGTVG